MDFSKAILCFTGAFTDRDNTVRRAEALGAKVMQSVSLNRGLTALVSGDVARYGGMTPKVVAAQERRIPIIPETVFLSMLEEAEKATVKTEAEVRRWQMAQALSDFGLALTKTSDNELNRGKTPIKCLMEIMEAPTAVPLTGTPAVEHTIRVWDRGLQKWVDFRQHDIGAVEQIVKAAPPEGAVVAYADLELGRYGYFNDEGQVYPGTGNCWVTIDAEMIAKWKSLHRIPLVTDEWKYDDLTDAQRRVAHDVMASLAHEFVVSWTIVVQAARNFRFTGPQDFANKLRKELTSAPIDDPVLEAYCKAGAGDAYTKMAEELKGVEYESVVPPEARKTTKVAALGAGFMSESEARKIYAPQYAYADEETAGQWEHQAMQEFREAAQYIAHPYHSLANVLLDAFEQAAMGKGKERHANDLPFTEQKIQKLPQIQGHVGGLIYQISKKAMESEKMAPEKRIHELCGVIVYAAAAVVYTQQQEKQS